MIHSDIIRIANIKFGVEIEIGHYDAKIDLPPSWYIKEEHCGSEIIGPPLTGFAGLMQVRDVVRRIHKWGEHSVILLDDCGFHVHVDIQDYKLGDAKRLVGFANHFNKTIYGIMGPHRRNNNYARQLNLKQDDIVSCLTPDELTSLPKAARYSCVNLCAFRKHGTVEFRYAGSTMDWREVYSLISLYLRMVAWAKLKLELPAQSDIDTLLSVLEIRGRSAETLKNMYEKYKADKFVSREFKPTKENYPKGLRV